MSCGGCGGSYQPLAASRRVARSGPVIIVTARPNTVTQRHINNGTRPGGPGHTVRAQANHLESHRA